MSETVFYFAHVQNIVYAIDSLVSLSVFEFHSSYDTVTILLDLAAAAADNSNVMSTMLVARGLNET